MYTVDERSQAQHEDKETQMPRKTRLFTGNARTRLLLYVWCKERKMLRKELLLSIVIFAEWRNSKSYCEHHKIVKSLHINNFVNTFMIVTVLFFVFF